MNTKTGVRLPAMSIRNTSTTNRIRRRHSNRSMSLMSTIILMRLMERFEWRLLILFVVDVFLMLIAGSRTPVFVFIAGAVVAMFYRRSMKFTVIGSVALVAMVSLLLLLPTRNKFLNADDSLN